MGKIGSKLELINGKFYRNGVEVKPAFGDWEQIKLLKEAERKANEKKVSAKLIREEIYQYYAVIAFTCPICKKENTVNMFEDEPSDWPIDNSDVDSYDVSCENIDCQHEFTIEAVKGSKSNMAIQLSYDPVDEL
jgi:transcription elongation factor Elf1